MIGTAIFFIYLIWNAYCFYLMFTDKNRAEDGSWRISEKRLLTYAVCFGAFGIAFGMIAFHHKINKNRFAMVVGAGIFINMLGIFFVLKMFL